MSVLPGGIPRLIHRVWVGGPPPPEVVELGKAWAAVHPHWQVRTWREWDLPPLALERLFEAASSPAQASDIARVELLHRFGGVYVDTDFEPLRPIDDLVGSVSCFTATEDGHWASTGIMGAAPRHPFIALLLDALPRSIRARPNARPNDVSGPKFATRQLARYRQRAGAPPVAVFPPALFYPYHFTEPDRAGGPFPDAYAVHRWSFTWNKPPPAQSVRPAS